MLVDFSFENFTSFYDEANFSMRAKNADTQYQDFNTFPTSQGALLKSCLMYGPNGSGKTNFLNALAFMKMIVTSELDAQAKLISQKNYFLYNKISANKPIKFKISFIIESVLYEYSFSIMDGKIIQEQLDRKIKRKTHVFTRTGSKFETIKLNTSDFNNVKQVIQNTREDVLFLTWANFCNNEIAMKIYQWFENIQIFNADESVQQLLQSTVNYIQRNSNAKENIINLMHNVGIKLEGLGLEIKDYDFNDFFAPVLKNDYKDKIPHSKAKTVNLKIKQKVYDKDWENYSIEEFGINLESDGTRKLFEIAGPIISSLQNGNVVLIDEFDARLHPALVRYLVMQFNSRSQNPDNAQLICNVHDVMLLDEEIRRDQIYFLEKDKYGISSLNCLADYKGLRQTDKRIKQYLLGFFGALPEIREI